MHFLIDNNLKLIFGFSAKCACSTIKTIFLENTTDNDLRQIYLEKGDMHFCETYTYSLPKDISSFKIILFIRNPYKRIVSGVIQKYSRSETGCQHLWKQPLKKLTFYNFINTMILEGLGKTIDEHHFTPQTTEKWDDRLLEHKDVLVMDIEHINYNILNNLFKTNNIVNIVINPEMIGNKNIIDNAWNIQIDELKKMKPDYKCLYNDEIKNKIYHLYKKDFEIFKKLGFDYNI